MKKITFLCLCAAMTLTMQAQQFNDYFENKTITFEVGKSYNLTELKKLLVKSGYFNVSKVDSSLEFANRGDILDIFSVNLDNPVRIEFFGDEVEEIRFFDVVSQQSISKVNKITILPGSDILLSDEEVLNASNIINKKLEQNRPILSSNVYENLEINVQNIVDKIIEGNYDQQLYKYYSLLTNGRYSLFDYCKDYVKVLVNYKQIQNSSKLLKSSSSTYFEGLVFTPFTILFETIKS